MNDFRVVSANEIGELSPTIFVKHNGLAEIIILFAGFIVVIIVMYVLLRFFKKRIEKVEVTNHTRQNEEKRGVNSLNIVLITILMLVILVVNFLLIGLYYKYILYAFTHLILIALLYNVIMIYMYGKSEKELKFGKVLLIISSILVLSNIIFYVVTALI